MENSYDSVKWSDSTTPNMVSWSLQSNSSDSDWNLFSSSTSGNFPADDFVGGIDKTESLSRSHRLAEKRRRDRINSHLTSLRKLVPNSDKLDKAALLEHLQTIPQIFKFEVSCIPNDTSKLQNLRYHKVDTSNLRYHHHDTSKFEVLPLEMLLATVIEKVKELKQKATESPIFQDLPIESDEVTVLPEEIISDFESDANRFIFKASFCCEDQPEAISEIIRVLTKLQLETIQAEIICVGGRMRINFILQDCKCKETTMAASVRVLKQSLCSALNRIGSPSSSRDSICRIRSKRQRWFLSSHYSQ